MIIDVIDVCAAATFRASVPSPVEASNPVPATSAAASTVGPEEPPTTMEPFVVRASADNVSVPESCDIITALSAKDVAPVPPFATEIVVPPQVPAEIVPEFAIPLCFGFLVIRVFLEIINYFRDLFK